MTGTISTLWITSPENFSAIGSEWDDLVESSAAETVFLSFDWLRAWWEHMGHGNMLRVLVARRDADGLLVGAAPLVLGRGRWLGVLPMRELSLIGAGIAIGVGIGVAIGVAMDNIGAGIAIGIAIGAGMGTAFSAKKDQRPTDDEGEGS